jgi:hypothetical protein
MERKLAEEIKQPKFFDGKTAVSYGEGKRDLFPLLPFIISGGEKTELYYFQHINTIKGTSFNIEPKYFGKESNYTKKFPKRISEILQKHNDAKIFCVFDFDTVYDNDANKTRHENFVKNIKDNIDKGIVVLCPSMPCIEYWFLLHFEDNNALYKTCSDLNEPLKIMREYFSNAHSQDKITDTLKTGNYIKDKDWVEKLCADGKLENAIKRAERNDNNQENHSYSKVYKIFKEVGF